MISRTHYVGDVVIERLESPVGDLPFFVVTRLGNVAHVNRHDNVHLLRILLDPIGLRKKTGSLIRDAWPVPLCLPMPDISVTLRVRKDDQGEDIRSLPGIPIHPGRRRFRLISVNGNCIALAECGNTSASSSTHRKEQNQAC